MSNHRMPLVLGISPSKDIQFANRAFHHEADTTKRMSKLLFGSDRHVAVLERHMHLINLDDKVVLGKKQIPIEICKNKKLAAVPREEESFLTLDQLYEGGMLQDRIVILLGKLVTKRFFDWIKQEVPTLNSVTHVVHHHGDLDCAVVYVRHPHNLRYDTKDQSAFVDLMCDALGLSDRGEVSDVDDRLDSSGRKALFKAWDDDYEERARMDAFYAALDDDEDEDPEGVTEQVRRERRALLSHYRRPFYSDEDCFD